VVVVAPGRKKERAVLIVVVLVVPVCGCLLVRGNHFLRVAHRRIDCKLPRRALEEEEEEEKEGRSVTLIQR